MSRRLKAPDGSVDVTARASSFEVIGAETWRRSALMRRRAYHESGHACACLSFGIKIISVSIANGRPHLLRGHYDAPDTVAHEAMAIMMLSGAAAEELFCGPIRDGGDTVDLNMLCDRLLRQGLEMRAAIGEIIRFKAAADRLVRSDWARQRIKLIATELMRQGTPTAEQIAALT